MLDGSPDTGVATGLFDALAARPGLIAGTVALLAFVESLALVGIVTPGIALLAAGAAAAGAAGTPLSLLLAAGWCGAVLGDGISFLVGHHFGPALRERVLPRRFVPWLEPGERFFARHGVAGVVLGRFLGPLRPLVPVTAGMLGMDRRIFFSVNLLSALAWSPAYLLPGYLVGASLGQALHPPRGWPLVLALGGVFLWAASRAVVSAWRSGERDGAVGRRMAGRGRGGRFLTASLALSGGADTRLSVLLASAAVLAAAGLAGAALALPAASPWRTYLGALGALVLRLW